MSGRGCCAYDRRLASRSRYSPPALRCCFNILTTTTHLGCPLPHPCDALASVLVLSLLSCLAHPTLCFHPPRAVPVPSLTGRACTFLPPL